MGNYETSPIDDKIEKHINGEMILKDAEELLKSLSPEITGEYLLLQNPQKMDTLIDPIIPRSGIIALAGGSDGGKSCLAREFAIKIVSGANDFLGFPLHPIFKRAIFCSSEDDPHSTAFILKRQSHGLSPEQLRNLVFIFETENLYNELNFRLTNNPVDLVIIDCFADLFGNDLKDTSKIRLFLHQYQNLATTHKCLILFVHHTSKRTEFNEPSKDNLLSGQGLESKMRLVMELRKDNTNPAMRHLCIVKANYLHHEYKQESYVLNFTDNFNFINTGYRVPFELIVKQKDNSGKEKYEKAIELKEAGANYEQIAKELGFASKSSVHDLFKKFENSRSVLSA